MIKVNTGQRKSWNYPWGYRESFMIVLELILLGLILQVLFGGKPLTGLHWPVNMISAIGLIILLIIIHFTFKQNPLIKWLSSIPAAVSAITFFAFVVLLLGFIPQENPNAPGFIKILGLNYMRNSWLMTVSGLYLLMSLGLVILRRARPLNRRNAGFLLNHAGLWITIFAGSLGSGDITRLSVQMQENQEYINIGVDPDGKRVSLPFRMKLVDFAIDEYPPAMGIGNPKTGEMIKQSGIELFQLEENREYLHNDWSIKVKKTISDAYPGKAEYRPSDSAGAAPAALIRVKNVHTGREVEGWITCGSFAFNPSFLELDDENVLFMSSPEPRKYSSKIEIEQDAKADTFIIEVNKPVRIKGYSLYQLSYDERYGKWSTISVIEAVKDPWLPVVYTGILMMLAGSVYLFWKGNEIRKE